MSHSTDTGATDDGSTTTDLYGEDDAVATREGVSEGLMTTAAWAMIGLGVLALFSVLAIARVFLVPVIMAFLLALVFSPLCRWSRRRGVKEPITALIIVLGLITGLAATTATLAVPVSGWVEDAPMIAREAERKLRTLTGYAETMNEVSAQIEDATDGSSDTSDNPVKVRIEERGPLSTVALGAPLIVGQTVFVLVLLYFILASGSFFYERLVYVLPTFAEKKRALKIAYDIEREISRYLLSITAINAGLGVAVGAALAFLGMPNPMVFGLVAFALNFAPFVGALAGVAITFAVGLVALPTTFDAFFVATVYFGLTSIEGQLVTPWLVGRQLRLNTVVILIAVAFWAWLWSVMGMIMAVPLLVCLRVFCRHIAPLETLGEFLSDRQTEQR